MKPNCQHRFCRKNGDIKVGTVLAWIGEKEHYSPIYMCSKHALKFIEKYGDIWWRDKGEGK